MPLPGAAEEPRRSAASLFPFTAGRKGGSFSQPRSEVTAVTSKDRPGRLVSLPWRETPPDRHEAQSHQSHGARLRYLLGTETDLAYAGYRRSVRRNRRCSSRRTRRRPGCSTCRRTSRIVPVTTTPLRNGVGPGNRDSSAERAPNPIVLHRRCLLDNRRGLWRNLQECKIFRQPGAWDFDDPPSERHPPEAAWPRQGSMDNVNSRDRLHLGHTLRMVAAATVLIAVTGDAPRAAAADPGTAARKSGPKPAVIRVGPEKRSPAPPSAAAKIARDGDVIEIDAGSYDGDAASWTQNGLTIRGVGGRAHLRAAGAHAEGKAIWVIKGANTTIENVEFSGAVVTDGNGAGIRQEGANLTVPQLTTSTTTRTASSRAGTTRATSSSSTRSSPSTETAAATLTTSTSARCDRSRCATAPCITRWSATTSRAAARPTTSLQPDNGRERRPVELRHRSVERRPFVCDRQRDTAGPGDRKQRHRLVRRGRVHIPRERAVRRQQHHRQRPPNGGRFIGVREGAPGARPQQCLFRARRDCCADRAISGQPPRSPAPTSPIRRVSTTISRRTLRPSGRQRSGLGARRQSAAERGIRAHGGEAGPVPAAMLDLGAFEFRP